jgi:hypothetical protein
VGNTQFIGPDVHVDRTTGALTTNTSAPDVVAFIALTSTNADDVVRIGRNFFSAAYLMVNYDAGEFTMWPTAQNITPDQNLVAVDTSGAELRDACSADKASTAGGTAGGPDSTGSSSSASTASGEATSSGGAATHNIPAIAGGVVGGVAGIASIFALVICFFLRRRKAKKAAGLAELHQDYIPAVNHALGPRASRPSTSSNLIDFEPTEARPKTLHELAPESKYYHELPSRASGETPRFELPDNTARSLEM